MISVRDPAPFDSYGSDPTSTHHLSTMDSPQMIAQGKRPTAKKHKDPVKYDDYSDDEFCFSARQQQPKKKGKGGEARVQMIDPTSPRKIDNNKFKIQGEIDLIERIKKEEYANFKEFDKKCV